MTISFGLDFGTSNSALAANIDGKVNLLEIDPHNDLKTYLKSVIYFIKADSERKAFVGREAINEYIATGGEGRYMQSIKTFLPDSTFEKTEILYKYYTIEELVAFILRTMKARGERCLNTSVDDVVLGRPVVFSEDARKDKLAEDRLRAAATLAGFKNITFQLEPVGAALSFESNLRESGEKLVLVGDFGGGTSDFTILKASRNYVKRPDRSGDILAVGGIYIGGDLFDADIMWENICKYYGKTVQVTSMMSGYRSGLSTLTMAKLKRWHLIPHLRSVSVQQEIRELKALADWMDKPYLVNLENLIKQNYGYLLFQSIEKAKCELSDQPVAEVLFEDYGIKIHERITKEAFEGYIEDKVFQIRDTVDNLLLDAEIDSSDIDYVFLTGGSSHVPLIRGLFENRFGTHKIEQFNAFTSVANGLGIYASTLQ